MNDEMDISLYGDSLKQWNEWVSSLQQQEWLLRWTIRVNKAIIYVSMPVWMVARFVGILIQFIDLITFRLFTVPLRILLWLILGFILSSCNIWTRAPAARPVLLMFVPMAVALAMVLISLISDEPDIRDTKYILCQLWPLSQRRLEWIAAHGTGKVVKESSSNGLLIPRDISWKSIEGQGFRVETFLPLAYIEAGKIKEPVKFMPYATLFVESPYFDSLAMKISGSKMILVCHKLDFCHLWELYKEREVQDNEEVIVSYSPPEQRILRLFGGMMPHIRVQVMPKGTIETIYNTEDWPKTFLMK